MDTLINDVRYALRSLIKAPTFSVVAILTLALGIGANTAMFSVVYGVLFRPLPLPEPQRLVTLADVQEGAKYEMSITSHEYRFVADNASVFEATAAATTVGMNLYSDGTSDRLRVLRVSKDYFAALGVSPELGRTFTADEDRINGPHAVVLSHDTWMTRFGGDRGVLGRSVLLDGEPYTVVGVMARFYDPANQAKVWTTIGQVSRTIGSGENFEFVGRLKRGLTVEQAQARLEPMWASYRNEFKGHLSHDVTQSIEGMQDAMVQDWSRPLRVLLGAIAFVLLIACANVANLTLGRAVGRQREMAVRTAIGASRSRVMRQVVTESVVLATVGGMAGLIVAEWILAALPRIAPESVPWDAVRLDGWALAFTFAVALASGLLFGIAPAWQMSRTMPRQGLTDGGRTTAGAGRVRLRQSLVVAEVALSLVLLAGAGLLLQAFAKLIRTPTGFDAEHVAAAEFWLAGSRYDSTVKIGNFYRKLEARVRRLPGVTSAAVVEAGLPLTHGGNMGVKADTGYLQSVTNYRTVTPAFFATLGIPLKQGRTFTEQDDAGSEPVLIVNETFAKRFLPAGALDRSFIVGGPTNPMRRIVGVVGDVKSEVTAEQTWPEVFIPSAQTSAGLTQGFSSWFPIEVVARTTGDPGVVAAQLRRAINEVDPQVPVGAARAMRDVLSKSLSWQRFLMALLGAFALLALALATVGLYGVINSLVAQRTHEIGVRMALGAEARAVLQLVLRQGMAWCAAGIAIGLGASAGLTRLLTTQLYGVSPLDPMTLVAVTVLLAGVGAAACLVPARRAAAVDPLVALRHE